MKKVIWIFALIALFFLGDRIGGFILKSLTEKSQFRYSRLYQQDIDADVLLVGNSRGLMFLQPYIEKKTTRSTFNLSYNGMPVDLAEALVGDYLEKNKAPDLMLLDVTMCDRINNQLTAEFNTYSPYSARLRNLIRDTSTTIANAAILTHLYRYNSEVFQRSLTYLNKSDEDWLLDRRILQNIADDAVNYPEYNIEIPEMAMPALNRIIKNAKDKGVKVKLVINPYFPDFADRIMNLEDFKSTVEKATGEKVYNYSKSVTDIDGFGDYQHLNKSGARLYIDELIKDGIFGSLKAQETMNLK